MSPICKMPKLGRFLSRVLGASALTVALAGPALADDDVPYTPPTESADAAQAKADAAKKRADQFEMQGGWAYKSGTVERANAEATRLQDQADAARAQQSGAAPVVVETTTVTSPELDAARAHVKLLKDTGGPEYKSGAVDRAENQVRELTNPVTVQSVEPTKAPADWDKPVEPIVNPPGNPTGTNPEGTQEE